MATVEQRLLTLEKACLQLTNLFTTLQATISEHETRLDRQGGIVKDHQIAIEGLRETFNKIDNAVNSLPSLVQEEIGKQMVGRLWDDPK